jgi:hypothetical protein
MYVENQLIYLLYGNGKPYELEAKFSILTALARSNSKSGFVIRVLAESPEVFDGWPVEVVPLDAVTLREWTGAAGYQHRRKACAIAHAAQWANKTIFVDTDTFFRADPASLFNKVDSQRFLVDEFEWTWADAKRRSEYSNFIAGVSALGHAPGDAFRFYNSGLCGLAKVNADIMQRVIRRIDDWAHFAAGLHTIEQIALSFELDSCQVSEGRGLIQHYYAKKEYFHAMLEIFFEKYGEAFHPELLTLCDEVPRQQQMPSPWRRFLIKWRLRGLSPELQKIGRKLLYACSLQDSEYARACKRAWWSAALTDMRKSGLFVEAPLSWPRSLPCPGMVTEIEFNAFSQRFTAPTALKRSVAARVELVAS